MRNAERGTRNNRSHESSSSLPHSELNGSLAVPDTEPWWRAVHAILDEAEREATDGARQQVANERICINSLGMADGAALVRAKLIERRNAALKLSDLRPPTSDLR